MQEYNIVDISSSFNKAIKQIINCIDMTITNNIMFDTMKRRVKIIIDTNPLLLLQEGGPYIFEYRDYIKNDQFDELFLNTENILKDNVKNEIKECSDNLGKEESNNIMSLLLILRDAWKHYSDKEKKLIKKNIKMILSEYCKFLSIDKN
jgi:hypothetical protein